jgi:hypothetical protein
MTSVIVIRSSLRTLVQNTRADQPFPGRRSTTRRRWQSGGKVPPTSVRRLPIAMQDATVDDAALGARADFDKQLGEICAAARGVGATPPLRILSAVVVLTDLRERS